MPEQEPVVIQTQTVIQDPNPIPVHQRILFFDQERLEAITKPLYQKPYSN